MSNNNRPGPSIIDDGAGTSRASRRKFLTIAASTGLLATGLASCQKIWDHVPKPGGGGGSSKPVDLGSGDTGILNYAYALEQLEAAFYIRVQEESYTGMNAAEKGRLMEIRQHEIAHREFFKTALKTDAIIALDFDFSSINFKSRDSVLATAMAFEDLGVSAYNGAGYLISDTNYLLLAGKIVSVEARHAAYIRDIISYGSFADSSVIDGNGLDKSRKPADVLAIAGKYIKNKINASNLPS
jgi:hypothetical protein